MVMKIIVAPDSFKGNLSAVEVADCLEVGIKKADERIEVIKIPVADGGEGTVDALLTAAGGEKIKTRVTGPLGETVDSFYGILKGGKTAVMEMAAAAGLDLVPPEARDPRQTSTYGVGELIREALNKGCRRIILGLGGSATNDGGMGMAQALGAKFRDGQGNLLGPEGKNLPEVSTINLEEMDPRLKDTEIIAASDVKNAFTGPEGATYVYGPQKGADRNTMDYLEKGMKNLAAVIKKELNLELQDVPGSGAAGGLGGGMAAFAGAGIIPGIEVVIEVAELEKALETADLVITGEGKTDAQTAFGKVPVGIAGVARQKGVPVVCISGGLAPGFEEIYNLGVDAAFSNVTDAMTLDEAKARSPEMLTQASEAITRLVLSIRSKFKK